MTPTHSAGAAEQASDLECGAHLGMPRGFLAARAWSGFAHGESSVRHPKAQGLGRGQRLLS
jgi:hypothetical protein